MPVLRSWAPVRGALSSLLYDDDDDDDEWVMRVYTSKLTRDSVVTYLFHDYERSMWLFCLVWHVRAMIKVRVQYTSPDT